jgi:RNA polymerase subunit RPABC4/transcription elongation factor Spt4
MSKEIENKICPECDSTYRIIYDLTETSGFSKFCPFCNSANLDNEYDSLDIEDNE